MISDEKLVISGEAIMVVDGGNLEDLPLALFVRADRVNADIGTSEWRLDTQRGQGRSYALILSEGKGRAQLAQGQVNLQSPCLLWLPPGAGQLIHIEPGSQGFMLSFAEDLIARAVSSHRGPGELRNVADRLIHAEGHRLEGPIKRLIHAGEAIHSELRSLGTAA